MAEHKYIWQNGPFTLLETPLYREPERKDEPAIQFGTLMALIHNSWIRALNSIYQAAPHVPKTEYTNFVQYAWLVYEAIKTHHDEEEEFVFPMIEKESGDAGIMAHNVEQHDAFESGMKAFADYLSKLIKTKTYSALDAPKLLQLIDSFRGPLQVHLQDEIATLVSLGNYSDLDVKVVMQKAHEAALANMSWARQRDGLPVLMLNHDGSFEGGIHGPFPPVPAPVGFVFRRVFTLWNRGCWKFTACDFVQQPRELQFKA